MSTKPPEDRIAELELELAAAQRTIDVLIARLERTGTTPPTQAELFDQAVRLGHVLEERTEFGPMRPYRVDRYERAATSNLREHAPAKP